MDKFRSKKKEEKKEMAIFPVAMQIEKEHVFRKSDPIIIGCKVQEGQLRVGTPICVPEKDFLELGRVEDIRVNGRSVKKAKQGQTVSIQINAISSQAKVEY